MVQVRYKLNGRDATAAEVAEGEGSRLREMFDARTPPMSNTDREFLQGHANGSQFEKTPGLGDYYAREAKAAGVDVTGAVYLSGLAAYPGDPRAWVRGRGDAQKVCEERGWGCEGSVNVPVTKVTQPTGGGVAADIVEREAVPLAAETGMRLEDAREKVREVRKPSWAK